MIKKKKEPKKRAKHYEKKLKLNGTFDNAIRELVLSPKVTKPEIKG